MSEIQSAEQARMRYVEALGSDLGELVYLLSNELCLLFWRWKQYVSLYATKPSRLDIINQSAPFFFWIVQETLWDYILLSIARLADTPETGKKQNLSLQCLPPLLSNDIKLRSKVNGLIVDVVQNKAVFAIDWRNRRIAHRDLDLVLKKTATPLKIASKENVDSALDAMANVLNAINTHYFDSTTSFRFSITTHDADSLLFVLRDGLRREEFRQKQLESGNYNSADWDDLQEEL